eukprot:322235_1
MIGEKDNFAQHSDLFTDVLKIASSSMKAKRLASQLIPKYARHFPSAVQEALTVVMQLAGDSDQTIKTASIKGLPLMCVDSKGEKAVEIIGQVIDSLVQMVHTDKDDDAALNAFDRVVKTDVTVVIEHLFSMIDVSNVSGDAVQKKDALRPAVLSLLENHIVKPAGLDAAVETLLKEKITKLIVDTSETEFRQLVNILRCLSLFGDSGTQGTQGLVDIITEQAHIGDDEVEADDVLRVTGCLDVAYPLLKDGVKDPKFTQLMSSKLLPKYD